MKYAFLFLLFFSGIAFLSSSGCGKSVVTGGPVVSERLKDGTYEGSASSWPNSVTVKVTIADGKIAKIEFLSHYSSWIGKKAEGPIPQRIIEKQSTNVDAVTGATNSSRVIMNAVQDAVEKAYQK